MEMLFTQQASLDQHRNRFLTDDRCHQHLFTVRWPQGFVCPACAHHQYYEVSLRKLFQCNKMSFPNLGYGENDHAPDSHSAALLVLGDLLCGCMG